MAKKTRKKSAAKSKKGKKSRKRPSAGARKRHKAAAKKPAKKTARKKKPAAKPKGIVGTIVGAATAVIDTLTNAERLHHKLEPRVPPDPE